MNKLPECPECDKLSKVSKDSYIIGNFIDWLHEQGIHLRQYTEHDEPSYIVESTEQLLAKYFDINLIKVETERRALLKALQEQGIK